MGCTLLEDILPSAGQGVYFFKSPGEGRPNLQNTSFFFFFSFVLLLSGNVYARQLFSVSTWFSNVFSSHVIRICVYFVCMGEERHSLPIPLH